MTHDCDDATRCATCQQDDAPTCEDCGDDVPDGEGCRHDGHVWCASCFLDHCAECADKARDDLASGDYERGL